MLCLENAGDQEPLSGIFLISSKSLRSSCLVGLPFGSGPPRSAAAALAFFGSGLPAGWTWRAASRFCCLPAPMPVTPSTGVASSLPPPSMSQPAFVKIKFDTARVAYRETLASAVSTARRRKPDAVFDVVGVSAGRSVVPEATANATDVVNTLTSLGVDPVKIRVFNSSSPTINAHEVRIYVR